MALAPDSLFELDVAEGRVVSIVDGNWHAETLPVSIVFLLCAGTLFRSQKKYRSRSSRGSCPHRCLESKRLLKAHTG